MSDIHDRARATAAKMLLPRSRGGYGLELTLDQKHEDGYDPRESAVERQNVAHEGSGFRGSYRHDQIDGTNIMVGDVVLIVSPVREDGESMPTPEPGDHILFDGVDYTVKNCSPWNYSGVTCGFSVQARAG